MAIKAPAMVYICTLCKAKDDSIAPASVVCTFSIGRSDGTFDGENFDLSLRTYPALDFMPGSDLGIALALCKTHEVEVIENRINKFVSGLHSLNEAVAVSEGVDGDIEIEGGEEDEGNKEGGKPTITPDAGNGKVIPPQPEKPEGSEVIEEWMRFYPDDYTPDPKAPKDPEERAECRAWFNSLPLTRKKEITNGKGTWPVGSGRWPGRLALEWHKSMEYAVWAGLYDGPEVSV